MAYGQNAPTYDPLIEVRIYRLYVYGHQISFRLTVTVHYDLWEKVPSCNA